MRFTADNRAVPLHGKSDLGANRQIDQDSFSSASADTLNEASEGISSAHRMLIKVLNRFNGAPPYFSGSGRNNNPGVSA